MKKWLYTAAIAICLALSGCNTSINTAATNVPLNFSASIYNSVYSQYMERPTFAEMLTKTNGNSWINIQTKKYGPDKYGLDTISNAFLQSEVDTYIAYIDKFLQWDETATKDKDIFDKDIGTAKTVVFGMKFSFHSGNATTHYLVIGSGEEQYYTRQAAIGLKELLIKFKNNELAKTDLSNKYQ